MLCERKQWRGNKIKIGEWRSTILHENVARWKELWTMSLMIRKDWNGREIARMLHKRNWEWVRVRNGIVQTINNRRKKNQRRERTEEMNFAKLSMAMALDTRAEIETWQCTLVAIVVVISGTLEMLRKAKATHKEKQSKTRKARNNIKYAWTHCHLPPLCVLKATTTATKIDIDKTPSDKRQIFSLTKQNRFVNLIFD